MLEQQTDIAHIWHPFTQEKMEKVPLRIQYGKGLYLYDDKGNSYKDMISSWWVTLHGHSHPKIAKAIFQQASKLEHVLFAGYTHDPAINIVKRLRVILPDNLRKFFFSDNGSTSVEIALKIGYQYWKNREEERKYFISFEGAHHGDTIGAMSVSGPSLHNSMFKELLFDTKIISYPYTWEGDNEERIEKAERHSLDHLTQFLQKFGSKTVACILEPCIQGSSGMRLCRPEFQRRVIELVKEYNILVIFDEVMTGFGRTGPLFALEHIAIAPDIICLSKGLTGGFLPCALTVTSQEIYDAFWSTSQEKAFLHMHSYVANPLGCSAAIASYSLLLHPKCKKAREEIEKVHRERMPNLVKNLHHLQYPRILGTVAACTIRSDKMLYREVLSEKIQSRALQKGLLLRLLGDTVYFLPPYCITEKELHLAYDVLEEILDNL
ncbi:MAG: adenosylmethionine--8-amino-7-oxononanoate transaminase [Desulfovibrionaceae bacterium]